MPGIDFNKLRSEITMEQVLNLIDFEPTHRRGEQWYGFCPLHEAHEWNPKYRRAFSVNVAKKCFYCHKCHRTGNQLTLWAAATNQPIYPAMIQLCHELRKQVPWIER